MVQYCRVGIWSREAHGKSAPQCQWWGGCHTPSSQQEWEGSAHYLLPTPCQETSKCHTHHLLPALGQETNLHFPRPAPLSCYMQQLMAAEVDLSPLCEWRCACCILQFVAGQKHASWHLQGGGVSQAALWTLQAPPLYEQLQGFGWPSGWEGECIQWNLQQRTLREEDTVLMSSL